MKFWMIFCLFLSSDNESRLGTSAKIHMICQEEFDSANLKDDLESNR